MNKKEQEPYRNIGSRVLNYVMPRTLPFGGRVMLGLLDSAAATGIIYTATRLPIDTRLEQLFATTIPFTLFVSTMIRLQELARTRKA